MIPRLQMLPKRNTVSNPYTTGSTCRDTPKRGTSHLHSFTPSQLQTVNACTESFKRPAMSAMSVVLRALRNVIRKEDFAVTRSIPMASKVGEASVLPAAQAEALEQLMPSTSSSTSMRFTRDTWEHQGNVPWQPMLPGRRSLSHPGLRTLHGFAERMGRIQQQSVARLQDPQGFTQRHRHR
jgi:hypothetical protein